MGCVCGRQSIIINDRKFWIRSRLGEGGFSYVDLIEDARSHKDYALKRITCHSKEEEKVALREVELMRSFQHHNIIPLEESFTVKVNRYSRTVDIISEVLIVMPYYCKGSVQDRVDILKDKGDKLPERQIWELFLGVCKAVREFHSRSPPIAHRDIKPANVMIADDGRPVLMDLGSANVARVQVTNSSIGLALQDEAAERCSMLYRAPELFNVESGTTIDERTDIWSLGCVLYAMAFLESPFDKTYSQGGSIALATQSCNLNFPENSGYSSAIHELILSQMKVNMNERPFIDEVIDRVEKFYYQSANHAVFGERELFVDTGKKTTVVAAIHRVELHVQHQYAVLTVEVKVPVQLRKRASVMKVTTGIHVKGVDASAQANSGTDQIWTNLKEFNTLTADMSSILELSITLPGTPSYVSSAAIGISSATVSLKHQKRNNSVTTSTVLYTSDTYTFNCVRHETSVAVSNTLPEASLLTCSQMSYPNFDRRLDSEDVLTLTFSGVSGGHTTVTNSGSTYATYNFSGLTASTSVYFYIDHGYPSAPSNDQYIFHIAEEITKGSAIATSWRDWTDSLSGMSRYNWEIFKLEKIGDELREEGANYLLPLYSYEINSTDANIYSFNYTPTDTGVYSLILEASDQANNSKYVRRFAIYDPTSEITITSTSLKVLSGNSNASYQWQTWTSGVATNIVFSWEGHFINQVHVDGGFLGLIQDYPAQLNDENVPNNEYKKTIDTSLTDSTSTRTQAAISNVNGITSFEVGVTSVGETAPSSYISKSLELNHTYTYADGLIKDGTFLTLWARATDKMGNTKTSTLVLGFDSTAPDLSSVTIEPNVGNAYTYTSLLYFKTSDLHSGIEGIDYTFVEQSSGNITSTGTIAANTTQTAPSTFDGYSLDDGTYFLFEHYFSINNCWLKVSREEASNKSYQLQLSVKNRAMLVAVVTTEVGDLARFNGIGTYQGITNTSVSETSSSGVRLGWDFIDSCYTRESLILKYWDPDGTEHQKSVHADAVLFDIGNLASSTTYNSSIQIQYDLGTSEEVWIQFTTASSISTLAQTGVMAAGSIVGIVFGVIILALLLIILLMAFMIRRGRLQKVNAVVVEPIRKTIRRRRDPGGVGYKQYNTGGYDVEDIYMYGGITYEKTPDWQYKIQDLSLGNIIKVGRFARIYEATLYSEGKSKKVVAKTLKDEFNEEDAILMKAKINFFGSKVGNHPCVLGFKGAVMDDPALGPVMLLEYCGGGPLKDWLTENKNKVNDDTIERLFRFSYDIARGMEFLAEKKIIHMRLAARNILLTDNLEARIAGFGPRHGDGEEEDEASKRERIPVKWIAPECLDSSKAASEKSDVWSYGITVWEIFSMGQTPYGDVRSKDLPKWLKKGNRLNKPEYCDDMHYDIMKACWDFDPVMRPSFSSIHKDIESLYRQSSGDLYYYQK
ncbi:hypothetical protein FSP39_010763 [Pinctada imbricata]|uniref:non-specific serine/threonine protein kinase n=1 Tax=Pinctada imbricata TaxID=66713 RepID=A0AA89CDX6_PINIB|nr:hypothetical protein FSP39_010763 [Pinctada imbricata]